MKKELIVSQENDTTRIALIEEGRLCEFQESIESEKNVSVGDIFIGRIKKLAPNLNAAFVNIGNEKDAFLHYQDLGPQFLTYKKWAKEVKATKYTTKINQFAIEAEIHKAGNINNVVVTGDEVLIQITKEPISSKGPRISSQISLTGRFMVLIPFDQKISISKKIENPEEKKRLRTLVESIKPDGFGVIIRTVAEGKKVAELDKDMSQLIQKWNKSMVNLAKSNQVTKILSEEDKASALLRDNFNSDYVNIICDDEQMVEDMKNYIEVIAPERKNIVQFYDSPTPLLEYYNIEKQLKQGFGKFVNIPSSKGAYLVIEHTEALHVIDVNSGNNINSNKNTQTSHALNVNTIAATEIARQLRLRDMGGIIVIDFIDMLDPEHRKQLFEHFRAEMSRDKAKHKILPPSKFGLIQMTRQRTKPEKIIETNEENPNKSGDVSAPVVVMEALEENIKGILTKNKDKIYLHVHPFVEAYLTKGIMSIQMKWFLKYKKWVVIIPRDSYKYLEYKVLNSKKEELFSFSN